MSCQIYCIEDCNGLKYVGSTIQTLKERFKVHKYHKKKNNHCSSKKLDLDNCEIYQLEECDISHKKERERYWINNTNCVNIIKLNFDSKEYDKKRTRDYKPYLKQYRDYKKSWGGDSRYNNNNLLKIDVNLFLY
jgi:hypothetical protein